MYFGCCVNLLPDRLDEGIGANASYERELAAIGYDYIELPLNRLVTLPEGDFSRLCRYLEDVGLPCRCCNDFMPAAYQIVGAETTPWEELERYLREAFARIRELRAPYTVFGSPWSRSCPDGFSGEQAFSQIADFLRRAGTLAADYGVTIAIEHNNHTETNMLNHFTDAVRMAQAVDLPQVRVLCDYYHLRVEGDAPDCVLAGQGLLVHTHIAKLKDRAYFADTQGEEPVLYDYTQALRAIGYEGGVSIEARIPEPSRFREFAAVNLRVLREAFQES